MGCVGGYGPWAQLARDNEYCRTDGTCISMEMGDSSKTRPNFASKWTYIFIRVAVLLVATIHFELIFHFTVSKFIKISSLKL